MSQENGKPGRPNSPRTKQSPATLISGLFQGCPLIGSNRGFWPNSCLPTISSKTRENSHRAPDAVGSGAVRLKIVGRHRSESLEESMCSSAAIRQTLLGLAFGNIRTIPPSPTKCLKQRRRIAVAIGLSLCQIDHGLLVHLLRIQQ